MAVDVVVTFCRFTSVIIAVKVGETPRVWGDMFQVTVRHAQSYPAKSAMLPCAPVSRYGRYYPKGQWGRPR